MQKIKIMPGETISNPALGWAGALAGPVLGLFGNLFNAGSQVAENEKNREWQEHMYQVQRQDALADWHMQNEYNSPQKQMERLAAAGLNPNLTYGNGAAVANSTTMPRASQYQSMNFPAPHLNLEALNLSKMIEDIKLIRSETNKNDAEAEEHRSRTEGQNIENYVNSALKDVRISMLQNENYKVLADIREIENRIVNNNLLTQSQLNLNDEQRNQLIQAQVIAAARLNLDTWQIGQQVRQRWEEIATGKIFASAAQSQAAAANTSAAASVMQGQAALQNAATNALRVAKENEVSDAQIGVMVVEKMAKQFKLSQDKLYEQYYPASTRAQVQRYIDDMEAKAQEFKWGKPSDAYLHLRETMQDFFKLLPIPISF